MENKQKVWGTLVVAGLSVVFGWQMWPTVKAKWNREFGSGSETNAAARPVSPIMVHREIPHHCKKGVASPAFFFDSVVSWTEGAEVRINKSGEWKVFPPGKKFPSNTVFVEFRSLERDIDVVEKVTSRL